ncbi:MAG: ferritin-like domain-containing protein [Candidatus Velthaea sp.]
MHLGTPQHRDLFCRTFIETHRPYEPEDLPWPELGSPYIERLRGIPFWGIARAMERKAGIMVSSFAGTLEDPLIREAVAVQGVEEDRHARLMSHLIERYDLRADEIPFAPPRAAHDDFVVFGYEECLDYFMGAALFGVASELDFFPANFVAIFEETLLEEARHITFFINWYRYEEARGGRDRWPGRVLVSARNYVRALQRLVASFAGEQTTGFAAPAAGEIFEGLTPKRFLEAGLAQNRRFMGMLDRRLVKPTALPALARVLLTVLRALPPPRRVRVP